MTAHSRRNDTLAVLQRLRQIGARQATSPEEADAAAYVNGRLRRAGMRVSVNEVRAARGAGNLYALVAVVTLVAVGVTFWLPLLALVLASCVLLLLLMDTFVATLPILAPRHSSQNIVGTRAISADNETRTPTPAWRVVLLAPLDSPLAATGVGHLASTAARAALGRVVAVSAVVVVALLELRYPQQPWQYAQLLPALYIGLLLIGVVLTRAIADHEGSTGALAALIASAQQLDGLQTVELWTVALGATSTDNSGLRDFLARYPFRQDNTLWIVLGRVTQGQIVYATRDGGLRRYHADPLLVKLAAQADRNDTLIDADPQSYRFRRPLATVLYARGYRVLTLLSGNAERRDIDGGPADQRIIERVSRLVTAIVQQLDGQPTTQITSQ